MAVDALRDSARPQRTSLPRDDDRTQLAARTPADEVAPAERLRASPEDQLGARGLSHGIGEQLRLQIEERAGRPEAGIKRPCPRGGRCTNTTPTRGLGGRSTVT